MGKPFKLRNGLLLLSTEAPGGVYNAAQLKKLAALCEADSTVIKATEDQRLAVFVASEHAAKVARELKTVGLGVRHYQDGLHQPVNCLGELCIEHQQDALGSSVELARELAHLTAGVPIKIGINGCARCCVATHTLDVSIVGESNGYRLSLGGKNSQLAEMASFMAEGIPAKELPALVNKIITIYKSVAQKDETLLEVMERVGNSQFIEALVPYSQDAHHESPFTEASSFGSPASTGDDGDIKIDDLSPVAADLGSEPVVDVDLALSDDATRREPEVGTLEAEVMDAGMDGLGGEDDFAGSATLAPDAAELDTSAMDNISSDDNINSAGDMAELDMAGESLVDGELELADEIMVGSGDVLTEGDLDLASIGTAADQLSDATLDEDSAGSADLSAELSMDEEGGDFAAGPTAELVGESDGETPDLQFATIDAESPTELTADDLEKVTTELSGDLQADTFAPAISDETLLADAELVPTGADAELEFDTTELNALDFTPTPGSVSVDADLGEESLLDHAELNTPPVAPPHIAPSVAPAAVAAAASTSDAPSEGTGENDESTADELAEEDADAFELKLAESIAEEESYPEVEDLNSGDRLQAVQMIESGAAGEPEESAAPAAEDLDATFDVALDETLESGADTLAMAAENSELELDSTDDTSQHESAAATAAGGELSFMPPRGVEKKSTEKVFAFAGIDVESDGRIGLKFASGASLFIDPKTLAAGAKRELNLSGKLVTLTADAGGIRVEVDGVAIFLPKMAA